MNLVGSHRCSCSEGYQLSESGLLCVGKFPFLCALNFSYYSQ